MFSKLFAMFRRKKRKTFEEKLEKRGEPVQPRDQGFAQEASVSRMHHALHSGHIRISAPTGSQRRRPFEGRGMSRSASVERHMRNDDVFMQSLMAQSLVNNTTSHRKPDVDTCHTPTNTPYHSPSGGYDTSPSDSGGGGSCD